MNSAFWDGISTGDAALAPYDANNEFSAILSQLFSSDGNGYVLPDYLNSLEVTQQGTPAAGVTVSSGAAFVKGFRCYASTSENLTIASNVSGSPRWDRIIIRISWAAQTAVLAVLQGTPAASPSLPALTQTTGTTWELELARVWVANGFSTITNQDIHDQRQFMDTASHSQIASRGGQNLIRNSEFFGYFGAYPFAWVRGTALNLAPTSATKPSQMSRGRALTFLTTSAGTANGPAQTFTVSPSTVYAIRGLVQANVGTATVTITTNSASPNTKTRVIRQTGSYFDLNFIYTTESDATTLTLTITTSTANGDNISIGQWMAFRGYITGPYREFSEFLEPTSPDHNPALTDTAWDGDAFSSGTTAVDLSSSFGGRILPGVKAIKVFTRTNDSASSASISAGLIIRPTGVTSNNAYICFCDGLANDGRAFNTGWIPLAQGSTTLDFVVTATGAGTCDVDVRITGLQT